MELSETTLTLEDDYSASTKPMTSAAKASLAFDASMASSPENYQTIRQELEYQGTSATYDEVASSTQMTRKNKAQEIVEEELTTKRLGADESLQMIEGLFGYNKASNKDVVREKSMEVIALREQARLDFQAVKQYQDTTASLQLANAKRVAETSFEENVVETVASIFVPFSDQILLAGIAPAGTTDVVDWALTAEGKLSIRKHLEESTPEAAKTMVESLFKSLGGVQDFTGATLIPSGFVDDILDPSYNRQSLWYWVDTAVNAIETFYVGKILTAPVRAIREGKVVVNAEQKISVDSPANNDTTNPLSPVNTTADVNTKMSQDLLRGSLDSDEAAKELAGAESAAEVYRSKVMPNIVVGGTPIEAIKDMPSVIKETEMYHNKLSEEIMSNANLSGIQLTKAEQQAQQATLKQSLGVKSISLREANTVVTPSEDGFNVSAVYAKSGTEGWSNAADAILDTEEALAKLGVDRNNMIIISKGKDGQKVAMSLEEAAEYAKKDDAHTPNFQVLVQFDNYWSNKDVGKFEVQKANIFEKLVGSRGAPYLLNPVNRIERSVTAVANVMKDRGTYITGSLTEMIKPLGDLPMSKKRAVADLLEEGNNAGHKYSYAELSALKEQGKLNDDQINAVMSTYKYYDTIYLLDNKSYAKVLSDKGYWTVSGLDSTGSEFKLFGKPVDDLESVEPGYVLDLQTGKPMSKLDERHTLVKLRDSQSDVNGEIYEYAAVQRSLGHSARRVNPTDSVLGYREGYYPKRYSGDYYVDKVITHKSGRVERRSVANSDSSVKAQRYAEKMSSAVIAGEKVRYEVRVSNELKAARGIDTSTDVTEELFEGVERGRSIQKYRGESLKTYDDTDTMAIAPVLGPIEAIMNSAFNTGRVALHYDGLAALETRFMKTFGSLTDNKGFPNSVAGISSKVGQEDVYKQAILMFEFIQQQKKVADSNLLSKLVTNLITRTAEGSEKAKLQKLADAMRVAKGFDPVQFVRSVAFLEYIVGHPTRQLILQMFQLTQVMPLSGRYQFNPKRMLQDSLNLKRLAAASADAETYTEVLGKTAKAERGGNKYSQGDWQAITDNFKKSGLPFSVDSNQLVEGLKNSVTSEVYKSSIATGAQRVGRVITAAPRLAKRVGFDFGEVTNLSGTFMVATQRVASKLGKSPAQFTARDWANVGDTARNLSWNMNRVDMFEYQHGWLSVPTQFMQVFHKALLYYTLGNKELTVAERAKIVGTNVVMYTGPLTYIYDQWIAEHLVDAPEVVKDTVKHGVLNSVLNGALSAGESALRGEDIDVNVDYTGLNPATGLLETPGNILTSLADGTLLSLQTSPGLNAISNTVDKFWESVRILSGDFGLDHSTPEKIAIAALNMATLFSGINKANLAWIGNEMEGQMFINSKFQPVVESNASELTFFSMLGLPPQEVKEIYSLTDSLYGGMGSVRDDAIKDLAKELYRTVVMVTQGEAEEDRLNAVQFYMSNLSDFNKKAVLEAFIKLDKDSKTTYGDRIVTTVIKHRHQLSREQIEAAMKYAESTNNQNVIFVLKNMLGEE